MLRLLAPLLEAKMVMNGQEKWSSELALAESSYVLKTLLPPMMSIIAVLLIPSPIIERKQKMPSSMKSNRMSLTFLSDYISI
jgi:hypothetical protein